MKLFIPAHERDGGVWVDHPLLDHLYHLFTLKGGEL